MELLKEKLILKKACWAFGAFETGKKLRWDSRRLHILISMLIEQDMQPQAFLIARDFLSREELEMYDEYFDMVSKDVSKNKVYADAHAILLGEDILTTKKKLRNLKR